jgi:hypothetical protein
LAPASLTPEGPSRATNIPVTAQIRRLLVVSFL